MSFVRGIMHPEAFHGEAGQSPFFEGWYVKLVNADATKSLALIPGLFRGRDPDSAQAFIQIVRGGRPWVDYLHFGAHTLKARNDAFEVEIAGQSFSHRGLRLSHERLVGEVRFGDLAPWPVSRLSPGVMGWYAWVPIMQCYHGILSLDHSLDGQLHLDGETFDFTGGRGYIEKDWGRSFPKRWVWMQSNHYGAPGTCVTVSMADVPWFGGAFPGFLVGFWHEGQLHRFTTYTGASVRLVERTQDGPRLVVEDSVHRLEVQARGGLATAIHMPSETSMQGVVHEHLGAQLEARLETRGGRRLFEGVGQEAAWEAHGQINLLKRRSPFARDHG